MSLFVKLFYALFFIHTIIKADFENCNGCDSPFECYTNCNAYKPNNAGKKSKNKCKTVCDLDPTVNCAFKYDGKCYCAKSGCAPTPKPTQKPTSYESILITWASNTLSLQHQIDNDLPLSQTTWIGTHNSFSNNKDGSYTSVQLNQPDSLQKQLQRGARQVGFDVYIYKYITINGLSTKSKLVVCHQVSNDACMAESYLSGAEGLKQHIKTVRDFFANGAHANEVVIIRLYLDRQVYNNKPGLLDQLFEDVFGSSNPSHVYLSDTVSSTCRKLPITLTKNDVLSAGKNIVIVIAKSKQCDSKYSKWVFDWESNDIVKIKSVGELSGTETEQNRFTRIFDDSTKFDPDLERDINPNKNNIMSYFEAGLNNAELYGFNANPDNWGTNVVHNYHCVWSWAEHYPISGPQCVLYDINNQHRFTQSDCNHYNKVCCFDHDTNTWSITSDSYQWSDSLNACSTFDVPKNAYQMKLLKTTVSQSCWVKYKWVDGIGWTTDDSILRSVLVTSFGKNIGVTNKPQNKPKQPEIPPNEPILPIQQPFTISLNSSWTIIIGALLSIILLFNIIFMCYMNCCNGNNNQLQRARIAFNKHGRNGYESVKYIDSEQFDDSEANLINV
eukprot:244765_1